MTPASHRQATRGDVHYEKINSDSFQDYRSGIVPARNLHRQYDAGAGNTDADTSSESSTGSIANSVSCFIVDTIADARSGSYASRAANPENNQAQRSVWRQSAGRAEKLLPLAPAL